MQQAIRARWPVSTQRRKSGGAIRPAQEGQRTRVAGRIAKVAGAALAAPRQAEAMIVGNVFDKKQGRARTDAKDGKAFVQDFAQLRKTSGVEVDCDNWHRCVARLDESGEVRWHRDGCVNKQRIKPLL